MHTEEAIAERLLERDAELERLRELLDAAAAGEGGVAVAAGPAGIGKTKLLEAAVEDAPSVGASTLVARASELERGFAFGVARQLFEPAVFAASQEQRERLLEGAAARGASALDLDVPGAAVDGDLHVTLHGLYWLLANLASEKPLVVAVDDLQWADEPSLRFLAYASRRLERLPVAVVATVRTEAGGAHPELPADATDAERSAITEIAAGPRTVRLEPAPLTDEAVAERLAAAFGRSVDAEFAAACRAHCGGNPFLLSELAVELVAEGVEPVASAAGDLATVVPERVGETIRRHLARCGDDARSLARALAILGDSAELPLAAELAGMQQGTGEAAARELIAAQILDDDAKLRFRHPLLRAAVEAETPALDAAAAHARAARLLAERSAPPGQIGAHLLASPAGSADRWTVERLRDAARSARAQGVPDRAATLLRRALEEPPPEDLRAEVMRDLGRAELAHLDPAAADHLAEARELGRDPVERAELAEAQGLALYYSGRHAEGVDTLLAAIEEARANPGAREQWLRLEGILAFASRYDLATEELTRGRIIDLAAELEGATPAERIVQSVALAERPGKTAADLYRATLASERALEESFWPDPAEGVGTVAMYLHAGRPDAALTFVEKLLERTRARGTPVGNAFAVGARAMIFADLGDLRAADADFIEALQALQDLGERSLGPSNAGLRLTTLAGMGRFDEAEALLAEHGIDGDLPQRMFFNPTLFARARLRLAQRKLDLAEADFRELGRRHDTWRIERPTPAWRSGLAETLVAAGRSDEAMEHATAELELARVWDTPKAVSIAKRAVALAAGGEDAIEGLADAVRLLDDTPWRLDQARARCDLGSALRRAGRRREAREQLAAAMDAAHACAAEPLAELAAEELRASGARPRRRALSGLEALTPSERRVAELAGAGRSNREIAQELFVTMATVETHLTRAYRKLEIAGRSGLAEALVAGPAA